MASEYADAKRLVENEDLRTVAAFYKQFARTKLKPISVPELVQVMIDTLSQDKRGTYHIRDLQVRLGRLPPRGPRESGSFAGSGAADWRPYRQLG